MLLTLFITGLLMTFDFVVGTYQARILAARQTARAELEKKAWFYIQTNLDQMGYLQDKRYKITLWMENKFPEHDIFLMIPHVRVFVQVGPQWQEIPTTEATLAPHLAGTVINLKQRITVDWLIAHQDLPPNYFELLKGYLHLQIASNLFISTEAEPTEQILERNDYYYIHLKPLGTRDDQLRQWHHFPGPVPIFIPMPPH